MPRRYGTRDEQAMAEFVVWSLTLLTLGMVNLLRAIKPRPDAYNPKAPDDPTHVPQLWSLLSSFGKIDLSRLKPPRIDTSDPERVRITWAAEDRPQWLKAQENPIDYMLPAVSGASRVFRLIPAKGEANPVAQTKFLKALLQSCPRLTLEMTATPQALGWQIVDVEGRYVPQVILDHVRTYLPETAVTEVAADEDEETPELPFFRQMLLFSLTNEYPAPLPFFGEEVGEDVLLPISHRLSLLKAEHGERVSYRLHTFTDSSEAVNRGGRRLLDGQVKPTAGFWKKDDPLSGMDERLVTAKMGERHYHTFLSVTIESQREERLPELAQIARDVAQLQSPRHNGIVSSLPKPFVREITSAGQASVPWFEMFITALVQIRRPEWKQFLMVLTPAEIASLWHLPDERYRAEKIVWAEGNAPSALTGQPTPATICLGEATVNGQRVPVTLPLPDRSAHSYVVGKTSTGKSTLLHNLIHQDIAAGRGVVVLDPHGKLIDGILARSIPQERQGEVVLLSCGDSRQPVPLNPFRIPPGVSFHTAFNTVYWVMRKVYADIWVEGQMDVTLRHLIQALLTDPEATPLDIERLFFETSYRQSVVARMETSDEVSIATLNYWRGFGKRSAGERKELYRPIQNRTSTFLGNRALEYMTCHPHNLDWRGFIDGGQIVLIRLPGEAIRSEVGSLGAIFLGGLFLAAEALPYLPDGALPRAYVFVDEVERFVTTPLPDMFSQARKFGLSLTLANQFMGQLSGETREGILGNAGTLVAFEVGPEDAGKLRSVLGREVEETSLLSLGRYRALVKTRAHGDSQPAFLLTTRDLPEAEHPAWKREEGQADFLPKQAVKAWLDQRYQGVSAEEEPSQSSPPAKNSLPRKGRKKAASGSDNLSDFE